MGAGAIETASGCNEPGRAGSMRKGASFRTGWLRHVPMSGAEWWQGRRERLRCHSLLVFQVLRKRKGQQRHKKARDAIREVMIPRAVLPLR